MQSQTTRSIYACYKSVERQANGPHRFLSHIKANRPMHTLFGGAFHGTMKRRSVVYQRMSRAFHDDINEAPRPSFTLPEQFDKYLDEDRDYAVQYDQFLQHCVRSNSSIALGAVKPNDAARLMESCVMDAFKNDTKGALVYTAFHHYLVSGVNMRVDFLEEMIRMRQQWSALEAELQLILHVMLQNGVYNRVELFQEVIAWYIGNCHDQTLQTDTLVFFDFIMNYMPMELHNVEYLTQLYTMMDEKNMQQHNPGCFKQIVVNYGLDKNTEMHQMLAMVHGKARLGAEFFACAVEFEMKDIEVLNSFLKEYLQKNMKGFKRFVTKRGVFEDMMNVFAHFRDHGAVETSETWSMILRFYLVIGDVDRAVRQYNSVRGLIDPLTGRTFCLDDYVVAKMLSNLVRADRADEALLIYTRDRADGIKYHAVVYDRFALVLLRHNKRSEGIAVFYQMLESGLFPSFHILLRILSRKQVNTHTMKHQMYFFQLLLDRMVVQPSENNPYPTEQEYIESMRMRCIYKYGSIVDYIGLDVNGTMVDRRLYPQLLQSELPPVLGREQQLGEEEQQIDRLRAMALGQASIPEDVVIDEAMFNSGLLRPDEYLPSLGEPTNKPAFYASDFQFAPAHMQLPMKRLGTPLLILRHMLALRSREQWDIMFYTIRRVNFIVEKSTLDKLLSTVAVFEKDLLLGMFFYLRQGIVSTYARLRQMYSHAYQQELQHSGFFEENSKTSMDNRVDEEYSEDEGNNTTSLRTEEQHIVDPSLLAADSLAVYETEQMKTFPDDVNADFWDLFASRISAENNVALNERVLKYMEEHNIVSSRHLFVFSMLSLNTALNNQDVDRCASVLVNYYSNYIQQELQEQQSEEAGYTTNGFLSLLASLYTGDCTPQLQIQHREMRSSSMLLEACVLVSTFHSHNSWNKEDSKISLEFASQVINSVLQQLPALSSFAAPKEGTHSLHFMEHVLTTDLSHTETGGISVPVAQDTNNARGIQYINLNTYDSTMYNLYNQLGEQAATISFLLCAAILRSISDNNGFFPLKFLKSLYIQHGLVLHEELINHICSTLLASNQGTTGMNQFSTDVLEEYFQLRYHLSFIAKYYTVIPEAGIPDLHSLPCFNIIDSNQYVLEKHNVTVSARSPLVIEEGKSKGANTSRVFTKNPALGMLASQFGINTEETEQTPAGKKYKEIIGVLHMSEKNAQTHIDTYYPNLPLFSSPVHENLPNKSFAEMAPRPDIDEAVLYDQYCREVGMLVNVLNDTSINTQITDALDISIEQAHRFLTALIPSQVHTLSQSQVVTIIDYLYRKRPKSGTTIRPEFTSLLQLCVNNILDQKHIVSSVVIASVLKLCSQTQQYDLVSVFMLNEMRRKKGGLTSRVLEDVLQVLSQRDFDIIATRQKLKRSKIMGNRDEVMPTVAICKELMKLTANMKMPLYELFFTVMAPHAELQDELWVLFNQFRDIINEAATSKYKLQKEAYDNHMMIYRLYVIRYLTAVRSSDATQRTIRSYDGLKQWLESPLPEDVSFVTEWRSRDHVIDLRKNENISESLITFSSHRDMFRMFLRMVPEPLPPTLHIPSTISTAILQGGAFLHANLRTQPDILKISAENGIVMDDSFFEILLGSVYRLPVDEILPTFQAVTQKAMMTLTPEFINETGGLYNRLVDKTKFLGFKYLDLRERVGIVFCKMMLKRPVTEIMQTFFAFHNAGLYPPLHTIIDQLRQACSERNTEAIVVLISIYYRASVCYNSQRTHKNIVSPPIVHYTRDGRTFGLANAGWNAVARTKSDQNSVLKPHLNRANRNTPIGTTHQDLLIAHQNEYEEVDLLVPAHVDGMSSRLPWMNHTDAVAQFTPKVTLTRRQKKKEHPIDTSPHVVDYQLPPLFTTTRLSSEQAELKRKDNLLMFARSMNRQVVDSRTHLRKSAQHIIENQTELNYKDNAVFLLSHLTDVVGWTVRNVAYIEDLPKSRKSRLAQYKMQEDVTHTTVQEEDYSPKVPVSMYNNRNGSTLSQLTEFTDEIHEEVFEKNKVRPSNESLQLPSNITHMSAIPVENSFSKFPAYFEAMHVASATTLYRTVNKNSGPTYIPSSVLSQALDMLIEERKYPMQVYETFQILTRVVGLETINTAMISKALLSMQASLEDMESGNEVLGMVSSNHAKFVGKDDKTCKEHVSKVLESLPSHVYAESNKQWFKNQGLFGQKPIGPVNLGGLEYTDATTVALRLMSMMENVYSVEKLRDNLLFTQFLSLFQTLRVLPLLWTRIAALPGVKPTNEVYNTWARECIENTSIYVYPLHSIELLVKCDEVDELKHVLNECIVLACLAGKETVTNDMIQYSKSVMMKLKQVKWEGAPPTEDMSSILRILYNARIPVSKKVQSALDLIANEDSKKLLEKLRSRMKKTDGLDVGNVNVQVSVPDYITSSSVVPVKTLLLVPRVIPTSLELTVTPDVAQVLGLKPEEIVVEVHQTTDNISMSELSKVNLPNRVRAFQMNELLSAQLYFFHLACTDADTYHKYAQRGNLHAVPTQDWKEVGLEHVAKQEFANKMFSSIAAVLPPVSKMFETSDVLHRYLRFPKAMFLRNGAVAEDALSMEENEDWSGKMAVLMKNIDEACVSVQDATLNELLQRNVKPLISSNKKDVDTYVGTVGRTILDFLPVLLGQLNMIFMTRSDVMNIKTDLRAQQPHVPSALVTALSDVNKQHEPLPSTLVHRTVKDIIAFIHTQYSPLSKQPVLKHPFPPPVNNTYVNFHLPQSSYRQSDHVPASATVSRLCNIMARVLAVTPNADTSVFMMISYLLTGNWNLAQVYENSNTVVGVNDVKHLCKVIISSNTATSRVARQMISMVNKKFVSVPQATQIVVTKDNETKTHISTMSGLSKEVKEFQQPLILTLLMPKAPLCIRMKKDWFVDICHDSRSVLSDLEKIIGTTQLKTTTLRGLFSLACRAVQRGNGHLLPMAAVALRVHAGPEHVAWKELTRGLERSFSDKLYEPCTITNLLPSDKNPIEFCEMYYSKMSSSLIKECASTSTPDHSYWSQAQHKSNVVEALHGLLQSSTVLQMPIDESAVSCYVLLLTSCMPSNQAQFALHSQVEERKHLEMHARVQNASFLTEYMMDKTMLSLPLQMHRDNMLIPNAEGRYLNGTALSVAFRHSVKQILTFLFHTHSKALGTELYNAHTTDVIVEPRVSNTQKEQLLTQVVPLVLELEEARVLFQHHYTCYSNAHVSTEDCVMGEGYLGGENKQMQVPYTVGDNIKDVNEQYRSDMEMYVSVLRALLILTKHPEIETVAARVVKEIIKCVTHPTDIDTTASLWSGQNTTYQQSSVNHALHPANHPIVHDVYIRVKSKVDRDIIANM